MNLASKFIVEFAASVKHRVRELQAIPQTAFCKSSSAKFELRFLSSSFFNEYLIQIRRKPLGRQMQADFSMPQAI